MDNLTHTLIGIGLGRAGLSQKFGRGTTVVLAVASNLPDIDVGCLFVPSPLSFLWRRTFSHCLLGAAALVVIATVLFRRYYPNLSWPVVFGLTAFGVAGHLFCDLWNAYGVVLLWPFSWRRFSLDWIYIIDLMVWGILVASWALSRARPERTMRVWQTGLAVLAVYVAICAWCSNTTLDLARAQSRNAAPIYVYPEPLGPQRFRAVVAETNVYEHYLAHPFERKIALLGNIAPEVKTQVVQAARKTDAARRLDAFFSTPVWRESPDHKAADVYGLEFRSSVLNRGVPFGFRVTPEGQVSHERLVAPVAAD